MKVLITGVSGVGKTTVCKHLAELGYEATDIENEEGIFEMYHKGTKEIFHDYDNAKPEHVENAEWLCDAEKLKSLLDSQKTELAFYSGIASNMEEIIPFFDKVIVLYIDASTLNERLKNREGSDDIGNNQEGRDIILGWKDYWENKMRKTGATFIDASGTVSEVGKSVLSEVVK